MTLFSICESGSEDEALPPEVCDMVSSDQYMIWEWNSEGRSTMERGSSEV